MKIAFKVFSLLFLALFFFSCGEDLSSEKEITSFSISGRNAAINQSNKTVSLNLEQLDLTNLTPIISVSANAEISPSSGVSQDFTNSVVYTVTAEDGSSEDYNVIVESSIVPFTYDGKNYEIIKSRKSWISAAEFAVSRGGYLVEINDASEQSSVYSKLLNASIDESETVAPDGGNASYVWIGGNDLNSEGAWIWDGDNNQVGIQFWQGNQSGSSVDDLYNNWGNEPDNFAPGQDALGLALTDWPLGTAREWNDLNENNGLYFVIEYD